MLQYSNAKKVVELAMECNSVPMIVGEAGIGKTSMIHTIAKENGYEVFIIEGNLLKEGEVTGLPTVVHYTDADLERILLERGIVKPSFESILDGSIEYNKSMILMQNANNLTNAQIEELAKRIAIIKKKARDKYAEMMKEYELEKSKVRKTLPESKTIYATFHTLSQLAEFAAENPKKRIILFIDEINRADHAVMQELMNLILNREINGFKLPEQVRVVAAANPSASFYDFKDTDYQVNEFDPAQISRLTVITMETSEREWLTWASQEGDNELPNILDEVTEFIASQPEMLLVTKSNNVDDVLPNPRAWSRVSETLKVTKSNKNFSDRDLYNKIVGDIGSSTATTFITFLRERKNPLITPEEIFTNKLNDETKERIEKETYPRKLTILNNSLRYLSLQIKNKKEAKSNETMIKTFLSIIGDNVLIPKELMVTSMSSLINNKRYEKLNNVLMDNQEYLDLYFEAFKAAN